MTNPVIHFEIHGKDAAKTQKFYGDLFGWKIDANNPWNYGMVDTGGGAGINGGIAGGERSMVTFYVQVADLQAALDRAAQLGGAVTMPITQIPGGPTIAMFADPDGNPIGLIKAE